MSAKRTHKEERPGISKVKLAIGAASLFLFIIGVKRTFKMDPPQGERPPTDRPAGGERGEG